MKIVIYTSPTSGSSKLLKDFLLSRNVQFEEHDISERESNLYRGTPIVIINDQEIIGFDKTKLEQVLQ